jgi:hypothetical protein
MAEPKFSYVPKAAAGEGIGRFAASTFGGLAQTQRALTGHALASNLLWQRTLADIAGHGIKQGQITEEMKTRGTNTRLNAQEVLADELTHGENVTKSVKEGKLDQNIILQAGKGTRLQARGLDNFRPTPKSTRQKDYDDTAPSWYKSDFNETQEEGPTPDVAGETSPSKPTPPTTTAGAPTPDLVQGTLPSATTTVADRASSRPVGRTAAKAAVTKPIIKMATVKPSKTKKPTNPGVSE